MIYTIGTEKIKITKEDTKQDKGTPGQIVGWRDVAITCKTLHAVSALIPVKSPFIVDGIARSGFWGAVFRYIWKDCTLHLNDLSENCISTLKRNFPNDKITNKSIHKMKVPNCDISLLDFDHFTLKIMPKFKDVLIKWAEASKYFIIADGACFGFKFGNMKHYGITDELDYYYKLDEALSKFMDKRITIVSKFTNAATILLENKKPKNIKFVEPTVDLLLKKGDKTFVENKNKKRKSIFG